MPQTMTLREIRAMLKGKVAATSFRKAALELGISTRYLQELIHGDKEPGEKALDGLGLKRIVTYQKAS